MAYNLCKFTFKLLLTQRSNKHHVFSINDGSFDKLQRHVCHASSGQAEVSGKFPCVVCKNLILCVLCKKCIHKRCSGISGDLKLVINYQCRKFNGHIINEDEDWDAIVVDTRTGRKMDCVNKFCYLGDVIGKGGGAEETSRNRVRCAWAKFNEPAINLRNKGPSIKKGWWLDWCLALKNYMGMHDIVRIDTEIIWACWGKK